jgi:hypothetical protein
MIAVGFFMSIPPTGPVIAIVPWRAPLLVRRTIGGSTLLVLGIGSLQGGVVDAGLGGGGSSGGVEVIFLVVICSVWVSGKEMDSRSWSWRAVPWSYRTVAWKTGAELHLIN